jgi:hypothetical protein
MTDRPPHASELVARAGAAIFGPEWQNPLARALGMNERTMRRLAAAARDGEPYPIAPGVLRELAELVSAATRQHYERAHACEHVSAALVDALD